MVYKVTPKELKGRKDECVIVDVREADELVEEGKIDGAVNMPLGQLIRKARQGDLNDLKANYLLFLMLCVLVSSK